MSLRVWLPLNGTLDNQGLDDIVVTNNGATIDNSGKIGKCYSFDGNDDYISLNGNVLYSIIKGGSQPFSIAMWVYQADNSRAILFGDYGLDGKIDFNIELTAAHEVRFYWSNNPNKVASSTIVTQNAWNHLVIIYDGTKIIFYKDGLKTSDIYNNSLVIKTKTSGDYYLGRDFRTGTTALNGKLNDFRIYDHALSPMEVKQISQGLILHYPLNNNSINNNIEYDCSGYCNNGIKIGNFQYSDDTPKYNASIVFSGSQYIIESNEINTTDSTIVLWIKSALSANAHVLDARNSSGVGKQPIYQYTNGSIQTGGNNAYVTTNTGLLVANTWVHIALVQSGNSLLIYKNGVLFQTLSCNNSSIIKSTVGARFNFSNKYTGQLSDLRIYVTTLSAEDIKSLYNNSAYIDNQGNIYGAIYKEV